MGQAKKRGTFEERLKEANEKRDYVNQKLQERGIKFNLDRRLPDGRSHIDNLFKLFKEDEANKHEGMREPTVS